jgi:hypothetical protein
MVAVCAAAAVGSSRVMANQIVRARTRIIV